MSDATPPPGSSAGEHAFAEEDFAPLPPLEELADLSRTNDAFRGRLAREIADDPRLSRMTRHLVPRDDGTYYSPDGRSITGPWREVVLPILADTSDDPDAQIMRARIEFILEKACGEVERAEPVPNFSGRTVTRSAVEGGGGSTRLEAKREYVDPDGRSHESPWWDNPEPELVQWDDDPGILAQSTWEDCPNSSCTLTAMMNGWIVRGALDPERDDPQHIQDTIVHGEGYADNASYWRATAPGHNEFTSVPSAAAYAVGELADARMPLDVETVSNTQASTRLTELLNEGYILVLGDQYHWRTFFKAANLSPTAVVSIDPQGKEVRVMDEAHVPFFHSQDRPVIKI